MATKVFKLTCEVSGVTEATLPAIIKAIQKGGRVIHSDAMLILGDNPPPEILLYGEDLVHNAPETGK